MIAAAHCSFANSAQPEESDQDFVEENECEEDSDASGESSESDGSFSNSDTEEESSTIDEEEVGDLLDDLHETIVVNKPSASNISTSSSIVSLNSSKTEKHYQNDPGSTSQPRKKQKY